MSWWVYLQKDGKTVAVPPFVEGGTIAVVDSDLIPEPSTRANISITYNYAKYFNFGALNGYKASDAIATLERAVDVLDNAPDKDYWAPTAGNTGHMCALLLSWARLHPDALWGVR